MRTFIRKVEEAIAGGKHDEAVAALKAAEPEIARSAQKGIVHANVAARKVSRLNHRVKSPRRGVLSRRPPSLVSFAPGPSRAPFGFGRAQVAENCDNGEAVRNLLSRQRVGPSQRAISPDAGAKLSPSRHVPAPSAKSPAMPPNSNSA